MFSEMKQKGSSEQQKSTRMTCARGRPVPEKGVHKLVKALIRSERFAFARRITKAFNYIVKKSTKETDASFDWIYLPQLCLNSYSGLPGCPKPSSKSLHFVIEN